MITLSQNKGECEMGVRATFIAKTERELKQLKEVLDLLEEHHILDDIHVVVRNNLNSDMGIIVYVSERFTMDVMANSKTETEKPEFKFCDFDMSGAVINFVFGVYEYRIEKRSLDFFNIICKGAELPDNDSEEE